MTNDERRPTGLLHSSDELRELIIENPKLPIIVFAVDCANSGDYSYMSCSYIKAYIEDLFEILEKTDIPFTIEINGKTAVEHKRKD